MNQKNLNNKIIDTSRRRGKIKALHIALIAAFTGSVFNNTALVAQTPPIPKPQPLPVAPAAPIPSNSNKSNTNNNAQNNSKNKNNSNTSPSAATSKKPQSDSVPHGQDLVSIDFPNGANLSDIIKTVGMWTGKNFVLAQGVAGSSRISIISPEQVTKEEAYQAFLSALNISGFTTVDTGSVVKILPIANAKSSNIKTYYGENWSPATDEIINQVIPLRYIDANTVINQLRPLLGVTQYAAFTTTNSLILTDTGNRIRRILEVIKLLDAKTNQPVVTIVPINYMDSKDTVVKVNEIFGNRNGPSLSVQKVLADERTNSIILVGPSSGLDDVVRFIQRIDKPALDQNSQTMVRVRPLDYADAEKLAQTLQALTQGAKNQSNVFRPAFYPSPMNVPGAPGGSQPGLAVADLNGVKVTSDKATNSLVIQGNKSAFDELDNIIAQLDKRRAQVYVEANIIDMSIKNNFEWSPSMLGGASSGNGYTTPFGFNAKQGAPLFLSQTGQTPDPTALGASISQNAILGIMSTSPINLGPFSLTPGALIFALKTDTNSNVLQTPSMMVSDNEAASFASNQEYSAVYTVQNSTGTGTVQQPTKYTVSTELKVTPQISRADFVTMKISLKLDDAGAANGGAPNPISKRSAESVVIVQNGQTAVIGGLTQDTTKVSETKIPLLGDIPILGWLFKTSTNEKIKTSLNVFITPHIVRNSEDLENIYDQKIKDRDSFLKIYYGEKYKKQEFYSRLPSEDAGKAPPPKEEINNNNENQQNNPQVDAFPKKPALPSEDPNPINAPSSNQSGGGGFGFPQPSSSAPPPPPFNN